jgi:SpoVK/Ycf46/Vps4 family AAA+-type ATPase
MKELLDVLTSFTHDGRMTPVLVGETGSGKTYTVTTWAEALGMPVLRVLLGTELPEDVLGIPRAERGRTRWQTADRWHRAAEQPHVIFLDELDKARPETHAAVLTLMWDRCVHDLQLHPDTRIVAAMQPVDPGDWLSTETGQAFSARAVWLPLMPDWSLTGWPVLEAIPGLTPEPPVLPILPRPSLRQVLYWKAFAQKHFQYARVVAEGMFPKAVVEKLMEFLDDGFAVVESATRAIRAGKTKQVIKAAPLPVLLMLGAEVMVNAMPEDYAALWARVDREGSQDDLIALLRNTREDLMSRAEANGGTVDIWINDQREPDASVSKLAEKILAHVKKYWHEA